MKVAVADKSKQTLKNYWVIRKTELEVSKHETNYNECNELEQRARGAQGSCKMR